MVWTTENQVAHTIHQLDYYDGGLRQSPIPIREEKVPPYF